jgi:hypothetical protein
MVIDRIKKRIGRCFIAVEKAVDLNEGEVNAAPLQAEKNYIRPGF